MKIRITSDSTCDLSAELIEKYGITILPLYIVKDGKSYCDGIDIVPQDIYDHVEAGGSSCTTAALNIDDYLQFFSQQKEECDAIVHFCISSEMSSCYQNACLAAEELGNVYPIDARNLSTGIGHLVLDAAELAAEGVEAPEIARIINERKEKLDVSFILDTLEYLKRGGRCSALAALGANLLRLKPCIEVKNGKMGVGKKYRGSLEKSLLQYVDDKLADPSTVDPRRIFITDSGIDPALAEAVEAQVKKHIDFAEIHHTRAGCTVSNHCGPNTLGILFYRR